MMAVRGRRRSPRAFQGSRGPSTASSERRGPMHFASYFISPNDLWNLIGTSQAPQIVDARRRDVYDAAPGVLPTASWGDAKTGDWIGSIDRARPVVVACKAAHEMSQMAAAELRARGYDAAVLAGGYAGWSEAKLPLVDKSHARPLRAEAAEPVGDAAAAEDRPRRLPVADPPLHRSAGAHPVRRSARGAGGREGNRRDPVRHRRRRDFARGPALLVRHHAQAVRAGGRAVARIASR